VFSFSGQNGVWIWRQIFYHIAGIEADSYPDMSLPDVA